MSPTQSRPRPRGPVSAALLSRLQTGVGPIPSVESYVDGEVLADEDLQLALHVVHELSYRGYRDVDERMEVDDGVIRLRRDLHDVMEQELRRVIGETEADPVALLQQLASRTGGPSLSGYLERRADPDVLREFAIHRSVYQLKEADPHSWALPRLDGRAKSALVEIQSDEYGRGEPGQAHAELWAVAMEELGLDSSCGAYVDLLPASTLATDNLISLLGMQRRLLPALIGHLALFEMTSTGPMARYSAALAAIGVPERGRRFFDVHVVADAHHEVLAVTDLVGGFLEQHPESGAEISFGARALDLVEGRFARHLLESFEAGRSSLRTSGSADRLLASV